MHRIHYHAFCTDKKRERPSFLLATRLTSFIRLLFFSPSSCSFPSFMRLAKSFRYDHGRLHKSSYRRRRPRCQLVFCLLLLLLPYSIYAGNLWNVDVISSPCLSLPCYCSPVDALVIRIWFCAAEPREDEEEEEKASAGALYCYRTFLLSFSLLYFPFVYSQDVLVYVCIHLLQMTVT